MLSGIELFAGLAVFRCGTTELAVAALFAATLIGCALQGRSTAVSEEDKLLRDIRHVPLIGLSVGSMVATDVTVAISALIMT